jgi:uncharacterized protein YkwD
MLRLALTTCLGIWLIGCGFETDVIHNDAAGRLSLIGAPPPSLDGLPANCATMTGEECRLFQLVNTARRERGLTPLGEHPICATAAQAHADQMAQSRSLSHDSATETWLQRMARFQLLDGAIGENIARVGTPEAVFQGWMNSPGHRNNLLSTRFLSTGVGYRDGYWVQCYTSLLP